MQGGREEGRVRQRGRAEQDYHAGQRGDDVQGKSKRDYREGGGVNGVRIYGAEGGRGKM